MRISTLLMLLSLFLAIYLTVLASPSYFLHAEADGCTRVFSPWISSGTTVQGHAVYEDRVPEKPPFRITVNGEPWGSNKWIDEFSRDYSDGRWYRVFGSSRGFADSTFTSVVCVHGSTSEEIWIGTSPPTPGMLALYAAIPFWLGFLIPLVARLRRCTRDSERSPGSG